MSLATPTAPRPAAPALAPWGTLAAIDLHGCHRARLADPGVLRSFVPAVIEAIGMCDDGPLHIERFADGDLEGWSATQLIETTSVTVHVDEVGRRCFVEVFSRRSFAPYVAAAVAFEHFGGVPTLRVLER